jgi:DNA polymerase I-like protein with 3'-5' exonuclease and polymerase domains
MEGANLPIMPLAVRLSVDAGSGKSWAEAH